MQPVLLYAIVVGGLLGSFFAYRASLGISDIVRSRLAALILKHLIYPFVFRRQRFLPPVTRLHILTQVLYWSGTVVCNFIGISDFPEASSRAGTLAIFHFIPLMLGSRLSFAADLLGLPYRTFIHLHSSVGLMAVVQSTLHVVLAFKSQNVNLQRMNTRFGLVVRAQLIPAFKNMHLIKNHRLEVPPLHC